MDWAGNENHAAADSDDSVDYDSTPYCLLPTPASISASSSSSLTFDYESTSKSVDSSQRLNASDEDEDDTVVQALPAENADLNKKIRDRRKRQGVSIRRVPGCSLLYHIAHEWDLLTVAEIGMIIANAIDRQESSTLDSPVAGLAMACTRSPMGGKLPPVALILRRQRTIAYWIERTCNPAVSPSDGMLLMEEFGEAYSVVGIHGARHLLRYSIIGNIMIALSFYPVVTALLMGLSGLNDALKMPPPSMQFMRDRCLDDIRMACGGFCDWLFDGVPDETFRMMTPSQIIMGPDRGVGYYTEIRKMAKEVCGHVILEAEMTGPLAAHMRMECETYHSDPA